MPTGPACVALPCAAVATRGLPRSGTFISAGGLGCNPTPAADRAATAWLRGAGDALLTGVGDAEALGLGLAHGEAATLGGLASTFACPLGGPAGGSGGRPGPDFEGAGDALVVAVLAGDEA